MISLLQLEKTKFTIVNSWIQSKIGVPMNALWFQGKATLSMYIQAKKINTVLNSKKTSCNSSGHKWRSRNYRKLLNCYQPWRSSLMFNNTKFLIQLTICLSLEGLGLAKLLQQSSESFVKKYCI